MAQLVVRNLDDQLKERLRQSAAAHGHSMEEEARLILHRALPEGELLGSAEAHASLSERIQTLIMDIEFPPEFFEALDEIRHGSELIDVEPRAATFDS
jgi:antitoxin FitA